MKTEIKNISFEDWKERITTLLRGSERAGFREVGKHGWSSIESVDPLTMSHGNTGPHWCDAYPIPSTRYLLGTYCFNTQTGKFFR
jgi:hypothetical protein